MNQQDELRQRHQWEMQQNDLRQRELAARIPRKDRPRSADEKRNRLAAWLVGALCASFVFTFMFSQLGLAFAVSAGNISAARFFVAVGADVRSDDWLTNEGLLTEAVQNDDENMARFLVEKGIDVNFNGIIDDTELPFSNLTQAVSYNNRRLVELFLTHGANANYEMPDDGETALTIACSRDDEHIEIVQMLLAHGADPNHKTKSGEIPLRRAANAKRPDVLAALKKAGAHL